MSIAHTNTSSSAPEERYVTIKSNRRNITIMADTYTQLYIHIVLLSKADKPSFQKITKQNFTNISLASLQTESKK